MPRVRGRGYVKISRPAFKYGVRYPWHTWFAQDKTYLKQGVDFNCTLASMAYMLRTKARKMKRIVSVATREDIKTLILTVTR